MIPLSDENPTRHTPWVTYLLIAANVAVFLYELSLGSHADQFIQSCAFIPAEIAQGAQVAPSHCIEPSFLTIFTSMFMHGGFLHIAGNMLYLWIFGNNVEDAMGPIRFIIFYLVCGTVAALTQTFITLAVNPADATVPNLGASGAIAGVLGGYIVLFPGARVKTLVILGFFLSIARISAIIVLGLWFVLQFLQGVGSLGGGEASGGVAVWAHVGGFLAGMVLIKFFAHADRGRRAIPAYRF